MEKFEIFSIYIQEMDKELENIKNDNLILVDSDSDSDSDSDTKVENKSENQVNGFDWYLRQELKEQKISESEYPIFYQSLAKMFVKNILQTKKVVIKVHALANDYNKMFTKYENVQEKIRKLALDQNGLHEFKQQLKTHGERYNRKVVHIDNKRQSLGDEFCNRWLKYKEIQQQLSNFNKNAEYRQIRNSNGYYMLQSSNAITIPDITQVTNWITTPGYYVDNKTYTDLKYTDIQKLEKYGFKVTLQSHYDGYSNYTYYVNIRKIDKGKKYLHNLLSMSIV
jgi:hypothetical protein